MLHTEYLRVERSKVSWPHGKIGGFRMPCPLCSSLRKPEHQKQAVMSVSANGLYGHCFNCGETVRFVDGCRDEKKIIHNENMRILKELNATQRPKKDDMYLLSPEWVSYLAQRGLTDVDLMRRMGLRCRKAKLSGMTKEEEVLCFNYVLFHELINTKMRSFDKHFQLVKGGTIVPYNIDAIRETPDCVICEGEFDCIALTMAGFPTISVPTGASDKMLNFINPFWDSHFSNKKTIYIASDSDFAGQGLQRELLRRFRSYDCRMVHYPEDCKDANDVLMKHGLEALKQCVENAVQAVPEGISELNDRIDELQDIFMNGLPQGLHLGLDSFDKLCRFETGRLAVVTGVPGHGKSEFIDFLVLRMIIEAQWPVAFFSPENKPDSYHDVKLLEKVLGVSYMAKEVKLTQQKLDYAMGLVNKFVKSIDPEDGDYSLESVLSLAEYTISHYGTRVVVIDPLNCLDVPKGEDERSYIASVLNTLRRFAQQHDVLLFLVAHPRKINRNPLDNSKRVAEMYDISGSSDFANKADYCLVVHRPKQGDNGKNDDTQQVQNDQCANDDKQAIPNELKTTDGFVNEVEIHVQKVKFKNLGSTGHCKVFYDIKNGRYMDTPKIDTNLWQMKKDEDNLDLFEDYVVQERIDDVQNPF